MINITRALKLAFSITLFSVLAFSCTHTKTKTASETVAVSNITKASHEVEAYYFHATRRCATCEAVESVTASALKEYYGDMVSFTSINRDEDKENPMLRQYEVSGQTLLVIKGDKVVNLTTDAFMNARTQPDKLKAKLKTTVDSML